MQTAPAQKQNKQTVPQIPEDSHSFPCLTVLNMELLTLPLGQEDGIWLGQIY